VAIRVVDIEEPVVVVKAAAVVANTSPVVANKKRSGDRHKDQDARREYQRDLMRKRRAEERAADGKTSATKHDRGNHGPR
jgi:hypothetical protein